MFDLVAVHKLLLEQAELVMNAVADRRQIERGQRIEETRRQTPQAAVAQAHVDFLLPDGVEVHAQLAECRAGRIDEACIVEIVLHQPAHQVLERKIIEPTHVLIVVDALRHNQAGEDGVTGRHRGRNPPVARSGRAHVPRQRIGQVPKDRLLELGVDAVDRGRIRRLGDGLGSGRSGLF